MAKKRMPYRAYIDMAKSYIACCHRDNATVIPDGASMPLPASVRRVMRAAVRFRKAYQVGALYYEAGQLAVAVVAYERAMKRGGK